MFNLYVENGPNKKLRCGYTTGTCAAVSSKAATEALLSGKIPESCFVITPKGIKVEVEIIKKYMSGNKTSCSVIKDAGDDIDATDGIEIVSTAEKIETGIIIEGGKGVGRVTKAGLDQMVGSYAINSVPRKIITDRVKEVCEKYGYTGGIKITISVPEGEKVAEKTFNPNIGITGGISIIGTTGIVEPRSLKAIFDTVKLELNVLKTAGNESVIITPGNYGESFLNTMNFNIPFVKCSNFIGDTLDEAVKLGFKNILLCGHFGKFVKLAGGMFNTHSFYGDCRMEILCAHGALCGVPNDILKSIMDCATVDAALDILKYDNLVFNNVIKSIINKIQINIDKKIPENVKAGVLIYTNKYGILGTSEKGKELIEKFGG